MQRNVANYLFAINFDNRHFKVEDRGELVVDTTIVFHFYQRNKMLWGEYEGGSILKGTLIGTVDYEGKCEFTVQHLNHDEEIEIGACKCTPRFSKDGKLILHET